MTCRRAAAEAVLIEAEVDHQRLAQDPEQQLSLLE
jgi:hypothetical protein